ncbi:MAG: lipopolysaccharide transport periplasmic protein LptA [Alphaproteobacteria bacterium]|nr:MAG: lipopolysaccharide transport periplasmic protein LptA [Alphaproteobacteria bacterium]
MIKISKTEGYKILAFHKQIRQTMTILLLGAGLALPAIGVHAQVTATTKTEIDPKTPVNVSKDVSISADELEANLRKDIVIFVGHVVVRQEDLTLNSDRITVFYQKAGKEKSSITRIDASGSVKLTTKTETIHATWGIYDFTDKIITLGGKVVLKRSDGEIKGKRLIYNLETGLITIEGSPTTKGRVTGQFILPEK